MYPAFANSVDPDQLASKKPTDLDLYCLPFSLWIHINNLDQVIWLAENLKRVWHLNLFSMTRVKIGSKRNDSCKQWIHSQNWNQLKCQVFWDRLASLGKSGLSLCSLDVEGSKVSSSGQQRLWSDCTDVHTDLVFDRHKCRSIIWSSSHFFVSYWMLRSLLYFLTKYWMNNFLW